MQQQRRHSILDPRVYVVIVGGLAFCLLLTIRLHTVLDSSEQPTAADGKPLPLPANAANGRKANANQFNRNVSASAKRARTAKARNANSKQTIHHSTISKLKEVKYNEEEGIAACLLVNDENPRLPEWIAYHYITLPLRSLIIAIDPASRSSPNDILIQWYEELGLNARPWSEKKYLPRNMRGPCPTPDDADKCLWHHRNRQQRFVMKCMEEFKKLNKTWVLLTDVDEYIVFNQIRSDDPPLPLDEPPEGIPVMSDWKFHPSSLGFTDTQSGIVNGMVDGQFTQSSYILAKMNETIAMYGSVIEDIGHNKYFLRDDIAYYEETALHEAPPGVPTLKGPWFVKEQLYASIYNDTYDNHEDGKFIQIHMNWTMGDETFRKFYGGHTIIDSKGRQYYMEFEQELWPPHYSTKDTVAARARLPSTGDDVTILDVLRSEAKEGYTQGRALGPCLTMPRLLYGSREDDRSSNLSNWHDMAPDEFEDSNFVTLRYRWHANKGEFEASKFGKTIIDVSRVPYDAFEGKALNIHRPLIYHCRKDPPLYSASLFRVNHYLDSFEAFSYRNDVRSNLRQCKECYEKKGSGAGVAMDDDIRPWLQKFVEKVGHVKAQKLLSKAGNFVKLES